MKFGLQCLNWGEAQFNLRHTVSDSDLGVCCVTCCILRNTGLETAGWVWENVRLVGAWSPVLFTSGRGSWECSTERCRVAGEEGPGTNGRWAETLGMTSGTSGGGSTNTPVNTERAAGPHRQPRNGAVTVDTEPRVHTGNLSLLR